MYMYQRSRDKRRSIDGHSAIYTLIPVHMYTERHTCVCINMNQFYPQDIKP